MALTFPNRSRSFDEVRKVIRFVGHDGMFEVPFLVEAAALAKIGSQGLSEDGCLAAFDSARARIQEIAGVAYARGRRALFVLTAADFK
jgi:hypothetical protein